MQRIGLTGGIAAGKSVAARRLARARGGGDRLRRAGARGGGARARPGSTRSSRSSATRRAGRRRLPGPGGARLDRVRRPGGARAARRDRAPDRAAALGRARGASAATDHGAVVVHDIPLLVETGQADAFHVLVVVHAPRCCGSSAWSGCAAWTGRGGGADGRAGQRRRAARRRGRRARRLRAATTTCAPRWTTSGTAWRSSGPRARGRDAVTRPGHRVRSVRRADRQRVVARGATALAARWTGPDELVVRELPVSFRGARQHAAGRDRGDRRRTSSCASARRAGRRGSRVERVAVNVIDARIPDVDGVGSRSTSRSSRARPAAFFSHAAGRRRRWRRCATRAYPVEVVEHRRRCTSATRPFYALQHLLAARPAVRSGFVHVPRTPAQVDAGARGDGASTDAVDGAARRAVRAALATTTDVRESAGTLA